MSIATDEAEVYARVWVGQGQQSTAKKAYERGRTATVTEAEIEAAARELWRSAFYRRARPSGTVQDFDDLTEKDRQHLTHAAQAMVSAARKQVSDE